MPAKKKSNTSDLTAWLDRHGYHHAHARKGLERTPPSSIKVDGELAISVKPWAALWVNGRSIRDGTPYRENLPAGRYRIRLINDDVHRSENLTVTIEPHQTTTIERNWKGRRG